MDLPEESYQNFIKELTRRESQIIPFLINDWSYDEIAISLFIAKSTLRKHCSNIYKKAGVQSLVELKKSFPLLNEFVDNSSYLMAVENKLTRQIDMTWTESNAFEEYYSQFFNVVTAMSKLDFSQRLYESDKKDSFLDFVAKGINTVNDELQTKITSVEVLPKILDGLSRSNTLIILSRDGKTIHQSFSSVNRLIFNPTELSGKELSQMFSQDVIDRIFLNNKLEEMVNLNYDLIPISFHGKCNLIVERLPNQYYLEIQLEQENRFELQLPRIMSLLSCIQTQLQDNPQLMSTILGRSILLETESILNEMKKYYVEGIES